MSITSRYFSMVLTKSNVTGTYQMCCQAFDCLSALKKRLEVEDIELGEEMAKVLI